MMHIQESLHCETIEIAQKSEVYNVIGPFGLSVSRMAWLSMPHLTFQELTISYYNVNRRCASISQRL